jgi:hypothetical protein
MDIPWDKLGISDALRALVDPDAPRAGQLAAARCQVRASTEEQLAMLYVLSCGEDAEVRAAALESVRTLPGVVPALGNRTHAKVLELLAQTRAESALDERIILIRNVNDRTAVLIGGRAGERLCESICDDHERLLLTPPVVVALHENPACPGAALERAMSFLRMQGALPPIDPSRRGKGTTGPPPQAASAPAFDLDAEIEAALAGRASPMLAERQRLRAFDVDKASSPLPGFTFDFKTDDEFALDLLDDSAAEGTPDQRISIAKQVNAMTPGQKIKLAYLGNKEVRSLLIRDRNKQIAVAVVKSGRLSDQEVLGFAGNRNVHDDVIREMAANRQYLRKYPVKVALVNNPKCPPSTAVAIVSQLQMRDLEALARNKNVPSVINTLAVKLVKQKRAGAQGD